MSPLLASLAWFGASPLAFASLLAGVLAGLLAGLTPGVSGRAGLLLVTPLAVILGPAAGAVFLVSFHSVVHTSGSTPAILLGVPTSAAEAATAIDGYAMSRRGEAARAIGAAVFASAIGGVIGALFLFAAAPLVGQLIARFGTPEVTALAALGLLSVAALSGGWLAAGIMLGAVGVLIAAVGLDPFTSSQRFTFGMSALFDGVNPAALVTGLFVVPELAAQGVRRLDGGAPSTRIRDVLGGLRDVVAHPWLVLRSSLLGVAAGVVPGMGSSAAVWIAYGHARQSQPSAVPYGEGAVAGVIAPEAANNAKEGGALAPTLLLGIPASSGMGILLAGFATLGIEVGPRMMSDHPEVLYRLGWSNILSNLLAAPLCIILTPLMVRFSTLRWGQVAPVAFAAALVATSLTHPGLSTLIQLAMFGGLGLLLKAADLPRAPLLLGFVLGPQLESGLIRSSQIYGWSALARPGVLLVAGLALTVIVFASRAIRTTQAAAPKTHLTSGRAAVVLCGAVGLLALATATTLPKTGGGVLYLAGALALGGAAVTGMRLWLARAASAPGAPQDGRMLLLFCLTILAAAAIGLPVAVTALVLTALIWRGGVNGVVAAPIALLCGLATLGLEQILQ